MKLSKYFTKEEFEHSNTAVQRSISNVMDSGQTQKAIDLCENVLDKIREHTGKPLKLNCGYRSPLVNKAVGGAKSSQHILGEAADLDLHSRELFVWIIENLEFDQAIFEFGTDDNAGWFHLSYRKGRNRKQALRAKKQAGKTVYVPFV
jgi:hypothetical protein